ncbi:MAG: outer membrane lipoprotein carrier protein LolA [Treponemataceae bacterium]|nr:outer membrane lipoprotein carrier protein LolA [Treponemataceae bacterium]
MKNVKVFAAGMAAAVLCASVSAQVITASAYFKTISEYYATIKDYEATVEITADGEEMSGTVSFKRPDLLRIDFSHPENQVIVFNGDLLTIYLPGTSAILQQSVQSNGASLATPQGLSLLSRYYTVAYETGQDPVPFEAGSDEKVVRLILRHRNSSEAFRSIRLAVNAETQLIREVQAVNSKGEVFRFSFIDYKLNQNISDQRFIYDAPSSANNYNNFLFSE